MIHALRAARGFSGRLDCWEKQPHQHADDGDHHQQFHQREALFASHVKHHGEDFLL
jgi:hypothetical protein